MMFPAVVVPVPVLVAAVVVLHVRRGPTASATVIDHAAGHRAGRQQSKEYRCNELLHIGSLYKAGVNPRLDSTQTSSALQASRSVR